MMNYFMMKYNISNVQVASMVTPVPGGVGPCTVACLMYNTMLAAKLQLGTYFVTYFVYNESNSTQSWIKIILNFVV